MSGFTQPNPVSLTDVAYAAGDFTAGGAMTWIVDEADLTRFWYSISDNKMMTVGFNVNNSSVEGTPSDTLKIKIPAGKIAATQATGFGGIYQGTNVGATLVVDINQTSISILRTDAAVFSVSTNSTFVSGQITFPIL